MDCHLETTQPKIKLLFISYFLPVKTKKSFKKKQNQWKKMCSHHTSHVRISSFLLISMSHETRHSYHHPHNYHRTSHSHLNRKKSHRSTTFCETWKYQKSSGLAIVLLPQHRPHHHIYDVWDKPQFHKQSSLCCLIE